jgi:transcriptional regulator with XRE-family HTH domain
MAQHRSAIAESVANACTESAGTVQALAEEVGVSYAALCSWSRGRRHPPARRLVRLAEVLDRRAERLRELAAVLRQQAGEAAPAAAVEDGSVPASPVRVEPAAPLVRGLAARPMPPSRWDGSTEHPRARRERPGAIPMPPRSV